MFSVITRLLRFLFIAELLYLLTFNVLLNLSLTQSLINQIKPEKFHVEWAQAWTFYPFHIYATDISSNGQSPGQQWQLSSPEASTSIAILPLLLKRVNLSDITARDIVYYQRPRPKTGKDYSKIRVFFPPIEGRELENAPPPLINRKTGGGWEIQLSNIQTRGDHKLWVYQLQLSAHGQLNTDMNAQTRGGPFSLHNGYADLTLKSINLNGTHTVIQDGQIQGSFSMQAFRPREYKGANALAFLSLDTQLSADTRSLAFLNLYLQAFQGMTLDGTGKLSGRLVLASGKLKHPTRLNIAADELRLKMLNYRTEGDGNILIQASEAGAETQVKIQFDRLSTYYADDTAPLILGNDLVINGTGSNSIALVGNARFVAQSLGAVIKSVSVPDLQALQRFLPEKWKLELQGGTGQVQASFRISPEHFTSQIKLNSENAEIAIKGYQFQTNLETALFLNSPKLESGKFDASGSYFRLFDSRISKDKGESNAWETSIKIDAGTLDLQLDKGDSSASGASILATNLKDKDARSLLANADKALSMSGYISDLRWLNTLVINPYNFAIKGSGNIHSNIIIHNGWLSEGTNLILAPDAIAVDVLDYRTEGDGSVTLNVIKGGEFPDISMEVEIRDGKFKRKDEPQAFIENVHIILKALARGVETDTKSMAKLKPLNTDLSLRILSADVQDMTIYNQYIPQKTPLSIISGQAVLSADIQLKPDNASGYVHLKTRSLNARVDEQQLAATMNANIKLSGGSPAQMRFNIAGSSIDLDEVRIVGESENFRDENWAAQILLTRGETVWRNPVQLDFEADLNMSNSIPLVSMMVNQKGKTTWLSRALTVDDVHGSVQMKMANQKIVIPYAYAASEKIDVGAKAIISNDSREGILYARYKKLHAVLKIHNGKRNLDLLGARQTFEKYSTDAAMMQNRLPGQTREQPAGKERW